MGFNTLVSFSGDRSNASTTLRHDEKRYYACLCGHLEITQYLLDNGEPRLRMTSLLLM